MEPHTLSGVAFSIIATITFGSTYVPLKFFDRSDGIYFQWVQSMGQLCVGLVLSVCITPSPVIPIAMLNGVFYSIGNSLTVFIMDGIGMAIGYLLWNTGACIVGWGVTRYGLFFNPQQIPKYQWLNFIGVIVICIGGGMFTTVDHVPLKVRPGPWSIEHGLKIKKNEDRVPKKFKKIICLLLTIFVGFLYGNFYSPINYVMNTRGSSQDVRTYFLSYCLGSFFTSTVMFLGYCIVRRNVPRVNPELSMPSLLSGILYGVGMISFFSACQHLDQIIAYPILSKAPGIVVSFWAIFLFKDIQGKRNIVQIYTGIFITILGISLISVSKNGGGIF